MKRAGTVVALAALASISLASCAPPQVDLAKGEAQRARVRSVTDGDTLRVRLAGEKDSTPVRLLGIDTPESRRPNTPVECGAKEASAALKRLALSKGRGRRVTLRSDPSQDDEDRYGRKLGYVGVRGRPDFSRAQVRAGWAKRYVYAGRPVSRDRQLRRAQRAARRELECPRFRGHC